MSRLINNFIFTSICLLATLFSPAAASIAEEKESPEQATVDIQVEDIQLTVPETWQKQPASPLSKAQFEIPGEKGAASLAVYFFGGRAGGLEQNLPRWNSEFAEEGRTLALRKGDTPQGTYQLAELSGTHLGPSFRRRPEPMENARMISIVLDVPDKGNYFIKLVGPAETVQSAADDLRRSIGADPEKEEKLETAE